MQNMRQRSDGMHGMARQYVLRQAASLKTLPEQETVTVLRLVSILVNRHPLIQLAVFERILVTNSYVIPAMPVSDHLAKCHTKSSFEEGDTV